MENGHTHHQPDRLTAVEIKLASAETALRLYTDQHEQRAAQTDAVLGEIREALSAMDEKLDDLGLQVADLGGRREGRSQVITWIVAGVSLIVSILGALVALGVL